MASFTATDLFTAFGGHAKPIVNVEVGNAVVSAGMQPGEKADLKFKVRNPNAIPVTATFHADRVQTVSGDARCASEIVLNDSWQVGRINDLPAGNEANIVQANHVQLKWDAPNYCQDYKFTVKMASHIEGGGFRTE